MSGNIWKVVIGWPVWLPGWDSFLSAHLVCWWASLKRKHPDNEHRCGVGMGVAGLVGKEEDASLPSVT